MELASSLSAGSEGFVTDNQVRAAFVGASLSGSVELHANSDMGRSSFAGNVDARLTRLTQNRFELNKTPVSVRRLKVAGTFTAASGETFDAAATLNVNNASEFDTFAWLDYSEERRWIYQPIDGGIVLDVFGMNDADYVNEYVDISVYDDGQGRAGWLYGGGYVADGQAKNYWLSYEPDTGAGSLVSEAVVTEVTAAIPQLTMEVWSPEEGAADSITIDVAEILSQGDLDVYWSAANPEFPE